MHKHLDSLTFNGHTYEDVMVYAELRYLSDNSLAITLDTAEEGPLATATVCLAGYGIDPPKEGKVYLKDYAENNGLARALEQAGLVRLEEETGVGRFESRVWLARLVPEAWS